MYDLLSSFEVSRIQKLYMKEIPAKTMVCLDELQALANPNENYLAYREYLKVRHFFIHMKNIHLILLSPEDDFKNDSLHSRTSSRHSLFRRHSGNRDTPQGRENCG
jgi:hypothetical protein